MKEKADERTELIMKRAREYRLRRERRMTAAVCAICPALVLGIAAVFSESGTSGLISAGAGDGASGYGSVLLHDGANAYVLTAVAAFAAGAVITVLCLKFKRKK